MPLTLIDTVGFTAGALTTAAFVPQVLKSWQTRDLSGVSLRMYSLFTTGVALWLAYGLMVSELACHRLQCHHAACWRAACWP